MNSHLVGVLKRVLFNGISSVRREALSRGLQVSLLGLTVFNIFVNDLNERAEGILMTFSNDTKQKGIDKTPESRNNIQNGLDKWETWAKTS